MTSPLVETKLYIPKLRGGLVARPRLSERLSRGTESRLTLISAPAGFGKTTLLAEWLAGAQAQLSALPNDVVLVLDDHHLVDGHDIQDGVAFLLEHFPPQVHLVISTRADPALPLARLRRAANWSRFEPPTCDSRSTKWRRTSTRP